jgi:N-acylneuraminate cytidylyltransferase
MNPWWAATLDDYSFPHCLFPDAMTKRSQDLASLFCPTGAIWIANRNALLSAMSFYGPKHRYHPMNWYDAIDIDDYEDLKMASVLATLKG